VGKLSGCFQQRKVLYVFNRLELQVSICHLRGDGRFFYSVRSDEGGLKEDRGAWSAIRRRSYKSRDAPPSIELEFS